MTSRQETLELIKSVESWYHTMDLDGVETPGAYDMRPHVPHYFFPESLAGLRVLDAGASNGFFTFHFEMLGAERVTAVDLPSYIDHDYPRWMVEEAAKNRPLSDLEHANWSELRGGFEIAHKILGSRAEKVECSIYDLPDRFGQEFDFVFCGNLLIHLRDPVRGLEGLRAVMKQDALAIVATPVDLRPPQDRGYASFVGRPECVSWWLPNVQGLLDM